PGPARRRGRRAHRRRGGSRRRPAPAPCHRPGIAEGLSDPRPGRGRRGHRPSHRGPPPTCPVPAGSRPHRHRHRPPSEHGSRGRHHRGDRDRNCHWRRHAHGATARLARLPRPRRSPGPRYARSRRPSPRAHHRRRPRRFQQGGLNVSTIPPTAQAAVAAPPAPGRTRRLALVGALYCTQSLSLGFFTYAFLTIAQARGVPLAAIGAAAGIAMILTCKFLWAPLIDRFGSARLGHYRGWLLLTQTTLAAGLGSLALFDPAAHFHLLLALFGVLFVLAGTQDIAADAAATRILRPEERGTGNGLQSAGACVAQVVGGGVVLIIYQAAGWQAAALTLAAFSLIALPFILTWREDLDTSGQPVPRATLRSALAFFRDPRTRLWCLVTIPAYSAGFTV